MPFHGRGRNGKQHLQRRFLRKRGAAQAVTERVPSPFCEKNLQDLAKQAGQNRKIRAIAHFNELKTYKSAKKNFFIFGAFVERFAFTLWAEFAIIVYKQ